MGNNSVKPALILFCGVGGVGKTSVSAAMAYLCACSGYNSVAFTVDPARRLANTLGLKELDDSLSTIPLSASSNIQTGQFRASMLNLSTVANELIRLYSPTPELAESIVANPVFQTAVTHMSNTEEYLAWGKVYQLLTCVKMDTLFIDTAPAAGTTNFFDAPRQLLNIIHPDHIQLVKQPIKRFIRYKSFSGRNPFSPVESVLSGIAGKKWLDATIQLLIALAELYNDFFERVNSLQDVLKNPDRTSIFLVTSVNASSLRETSRIASGLLSADMPLKAVVFNRTAPPFFPAARSEKTGNPTGEHVPENVSEKLRRFIDRYQARVELETRMMNSFLKTFPAHTDSYRIPLLPFEAASLADLEQMHPYLLECRKYF